MVDPEIQPSQGRDRVRTARHRYLPPAPGLLHSSSIHFRPFILYLFFEGAWNRYSDPWNRAPLKITETTWEADDKATTSCFTANCNGDQRRVCLAMNYISKNLDTDLSLKKDP